jgi:F-box and WD-40 domain protein 1/11
MTPFRRRLQSMPLVPQDDDLASGLQGLSLDRNEDLEIDEKKQGGLRGLFRKASVSLRTRKRRHSHVVTSAERPQTAWGKLRTVTSFHRHSRFMPMSFDNEGPFDSHEELLSPIPGSGSAPPIIPHGSGGAAARATAAAQNEYFGRNRHHLMADDHMGDRESGIGIAVSPPNIVGSAEDVSSNGISRVDFIGALPAELGIQILKHVNQETLRNAGLVSKRWHMVSMTDDIWRTMFLRDQTKAYATSKPVPLGAGLGLPSKVSDWKELYRIRENLRQNWVSGAAEAVYLHGHTDSIYCVQFDENKIVTGSRDRTIRIWDMRTYQCRLVIGPPEVVKNPDILTGEDGMLAHYATVPESERAGESTPKTVSYSIYHNQSILCLQYDKEILVTGSSDSTCIVYDIKDNYRPVRRLQHHTAAVLDLAFDERYIVTCSKDVTICVWDRETGVMLKQLRGHSGPVNAVQMRGNTIVSCSGDFKVKLWNIDTGKNIKELAGHTKGLACSQFSDDSRFIASAGNDKIIRIWDANTGLCLRSIAAHDNLVRSLHIDSISGRLVSGSYDQDIKVFDMNTGSLLLDFPKWHTSWVLGAKSDYRRIISTGQDPKILIMDFGMNIPGIEKLES